MHVGFDDTDSAKGGCTTYLAALVIEKLEELKVHFIDYPNLIRLNPNVPWKTRGNGALCLRFKHDKSLDEKIREAAISLWRDNSAVKEKGTDPGIVFLQGREIPKKLALFARKAETGIVTLKEAMALIEKFQAEALGFNTRRGIIGALAAIGETLKGDHTYELIAYREPQNLGSLRKVDRASVFEMDRLTQPYTFNNVDLEKRRVIITPRGPDPILFGIRGESPGIVKKAYGLVKSHEAVDRWVVFRSNQGTDVHLKSVEALNRITPYSSIIAKGIVSQSPRIVPLRHVIFSIKDDSREVNCAAFEPTGTLRKIAGQLAVGDCIEAFGGVHKPTKGKPLTINLEKINVLKLKPKILLENPLCPNCGKRLKSMGKNQGFRCEKCGKRYGGYSKREVSVPRSLELGLHVTSTRSQRHLTKPCRRYGLEKDSASIQGLISEWHFP
jgi:tRNA(Ile2)-agmatinylcytidine synthase